MDNHDLLIVHCHETRKNLDDSTLQRLAWITQGECHGAAALLDHSDELEFARLCTHMWAQALVWLPQSRFDLLHASNTAFDMQRTTNSCASSRSSSPSP